MSIDYHIRRATSDDIPVMVRHRDRMFSEMGLAFDQIELAAAFVPWVRDAMARGVYHGWMAESADGACVGGAGVTVLPWPPAPGNLRGRLAFVYNVYTERAHRRRGVARALMEAIHAWCREQRIDVVALHASDEGRPLYESMGYRATNEMQLALPR